MNNINIIKDENENINKNKRNNIFNIYKSISLNPKENKNKIIIPFNEKNSYRTNENQLSNTKYNNNNSPFSVRDKIIINSKNKVKVELPSLNKIPNKSSEINNIFKHIQIHNNGNESPSTSAFTNSTKKNINTQNLTEQMSKYRMGLLSANSSSNNNNSNPIIPLLSIKRPVSNFNSGGVPLWEIENIKNNKKDNSNNKNEFETENINKKILSQKNDINQLTKKTPTRNRNIAKSCDNKVKSLNSVKYNKNIEINNITNNIIPKLHKIKIEKAMFNMNFVNKQLFENNDNKSILGDNFKNNIFHIKNKNKSVGIKKNNF